MSIVKMTSYDLKGTKLSFADWISNISPTETPFCSMTGKESISQTKFQWQTDVLPKPDAENAVAEGSKPDETILVGTVVKDNVTQIFRRGVSVSDTANTVAYYGRGKEIGYQMEKASLELKRDMEKAFLWQAGKTESSSSVKVAKTAGFLGQVGASDSTTTWKSWSEIKSLGDGDKPKYLDPDTGAAVAFQTEVAITAGNTGVTEDELFAMTYNLYLANSKANIIMFHPKHASFFSALMQGGVGDGRIKMFDSMDDEYNVEVDTIIDPLGQRFALVPNRQMPENYLYFFNPADWTQMVLRAPKKIELAKQGSSQEWMIEAEIGLRHRNPFASGIIKIKTA